MIAPSVPPSGPQILLVLDGEERAALAVVRSLIRAGHRVHVAARNRYAPAAASRGAVKHLLSSSPLSTPADYAREVGRVAAAIGAQVVIPITDASAEAILGRPEDLPPSVRLPFASRDVYRAASDKVRVHELAVSFGIGIEETRNVLRAGEPAPDVDALYPGYVKLHRSVVGAESRTKTGVRFVADRDACTAVLRSLPDEAFPVLVQRAVRGPGEGVFVARWGGRTIARFAHRRLREKPPAGGVSVFRESIALAPDVALACDRLLDALDWQGVAMIEGKRDLDRGGWRVMEINGRFWGSLQLAIDAGVDFPRLLLDAVTGLPLGEPTSWRQGLRLRWEWGDVDHLLIRLRRSRAELRLPADAPGRMAALLQFLTHHPGRDRLEVLRLGDPLPFVAETLVRLGLGK